MTFPLVLAAMLIMTSPSAEGATSAAMGPGAATAQEAHHAYVTAINSNDLNTLLGMLTDDVVFLSSGEAVMVGKAAVKPWLEEYFKAYRAHWDKPVQEFTVSGEWAFERYSYVATDTPVGGGAPLRDTGWGLVIYHREKDGKWRVARDAWGPDHLPAAPVASAEAPRDHVIPVASAAGLESIERELAPCVQAARRTLPDVIHRFEHGLSPSDQLSVTVRLHDAKGHQEQVFVHVVRIIDGTIDGRVVSDIGLVEGYSTDQRIRVRVEDVLDWTISKPDGSEEGNLLGKYLESGAACDGQTAPATKRQ